MVEAAKYQQTTLYKLYITIHFLRNKNSVLNFLLNMHFRVKKEKVTVARRIYYKIKSLSDNKTVIDLHQTTNDKTMEAKAIMARPLWQDCST